MNFIVLQPRSGSAFISHVINHSVREAVCGYQHLMWLSGYQSVKASFGYYDGTYTTEHIRHLLRYYSLRPTMTIDSSFLSAWIMGPILEEYPNAKFVHIVRNPKDSVRSAMNQHEMYGKVFYDQKARDLFLRWALAENKPWMFLLMDNMMTNLPKIRHPKWDSLTCFEKNCAFWAEGQKLIFDHLSNRPHYLRIHLEDLTNATAAQPIFEFLGLKTPNADRLEKALSNKINTAEDSMFKELVKIKEQLGFEILPKFEEWTTAQKQFFADTCGPIAKQLGY